LAGSGSTIPTSLTTFHRSGRSREFFFASFFLTAKKKEDMRHALPPMHTKPISNKIVKLATRQNQQFRQTPNKKLFINFIPTFNRKFSA